MIDGGKKQFFQFSDPISRKNGAGVKNIVIVIDASGAFCRICRGVKVPIFDPKPLCRLQRVDSKRSQLPGSKTLVINRVQLRIGLFEFLLRIFRCLLKFLGVARR